MNRKKVLLRITLFLLLLLGCNFTQLAPELTPTPLPPTPTNAPTNTPVPTSTPLPPTATSTPIFIPGIDKPIIVNESGFTGELQILEAYTQESLGSGDSATYPDDRSNVFLFISFTPDLREWIPHNTALVCDAKDFDHVSNGYVFDGGIVAEFFQIYVVPGDANFSECTLQLPDSKEIPLALFFEDEPSTSKTPEIFMTATPLSFSLGDDNWKEKIVSDFSQNDNLWTTGSFKDYYKIMNIDIVDGKYQWDAIAKDGFFHTSCPDMEPVSDFVISVECNQLNKRISAGCGLLFRKVNDSNFYMFGVSTFTGTYSFFELSKNEWVTLIDWRDSSLIFADQPNSISVVGNGNHFTFYINNDEVDDFYDDTFEVGLVGVYIEIFHPGDQSIFEFDNFFLRIP